MQKPLVLITGATGMVGTMVARRAIEAGYPVRAMVRPGSPCGELLDLGAKIAVADLAQPETIPAAVAGAEIVVHAAARVGDWGPIEPYRAVNVFALEHLLAAAEHEGRLRRFVHISSLGIYPARHHYGTDENTAPDLAGLDGYTRTKAEAELVVEDHIRRNGFPAVILRPGFIYGPGDRHVLPPLAERLREGKMRLIGDGRRLLNNTYVGNLADAVLLAIEQDKAVGRTYNIRDGRLVDRVEFVGTVADCLGCPRPRHVPEWLANSLAGPIESFARLCGSTEAPILTRARIKFLTLNLDYSIVRAEAELGYRPEVDFQAGMRVAMEWLRKAEDNGR